MPIATNTFFGREKQLCTMIDVLDPLKPGPKRIILYGMPGSGKTQLALRYTEKHQSLFSSIFWINASTPDSASTSFSEAAALIVRSWPTKDLPIPYQGSDDRRRVVSRLRSTRYTQWLLVIDSVDDIYGRDFTEYLPGPDCQHGSIIITSARKEVAGILGMKGEEIGSLDPHNGQQLLLARISQSTASSVPGMSAEGKYSFHSEALPSHIYQTRMLPKRLRKNLTAFRWQ